MEDRGEVEERGFWRGRFAQIARHQLAKSKGSLLWAAVCTLGLTVTELLKPWPLKVIFDNVLLGKALPRSLHLLSGLLAHGKVTSIVVISTSLVVIALLRGVDPHRALAGSDPRWDVRDDVRAQLALESDRPRDDPGAPREPLLPLPEGEAPGAQAAEEGGRDRIANQRGDVDRLTRAGVRA